MFILGQAFSSSKYAVNYFDVFVVLWLILGVFMGRKHGMSQEVLPMVQWIAIVILAGMFYGPIAQFLHQNANLELVLASIIGYVLVGLVVHFIFLWIKQGIGEKLVGSDMFGRAEYYLGMAGGAVRFACMLVCLIALMNVRIITDVEMARSEKVQRQNFEGIRFPTYGSVQHAVLFESLTGRTVKANMSHLLIASITGSGSGPKGKGESIAKKKEQELNEILGGKK